MNPKQYYVVIDLEAVQNAITKRQFVSGIGLCIGDNKGNILITKKWWIKLPQNFKVDQDQKVEFWDKNLHVWDEMIKNGGNEKEQIQSFVSVYDSFIKDLSDGDEYTNINLVSDNPEFDYGSLNELVSRHCDRVNIR